MKSAFLSKQIPLISAIIQENSLTCKTTLRGRRKLIKGQEKKKRILFNNSSFSVEIYLEFYFSIPLQRVEQIVSPRM